MEERTTQAAVAAGELPRYYVVRPGRALHWPRTVTVRNRLWADTGWVVDLSDPHLRRLAESQLEQKLKPLEGPIPKGRRVVGLEQAPRQVKAAAAEHMRALRRAPTPDPRAALERTFGMADLPGLTLPNETQMTDEQRAQMEAARKKRLEELRDEFRLDTIRRIVGVLTEEQLNALSVALAGAEGADEETEAIWAAIDLASSERKTESTKED